MPAAARYGDSVAGTTAGEHSGHTDSPHGAIPFTGTITDGCSGNVFINGKSAATQTSITTEYDECCGSDKGTIAAGSGSVFINGKPAARVGDAIAPHSGSGKVTSGSGNVLIGG